MDSKVNTKEPAVCKECGKQLTRRSSLKIHMQKAHPYNNVSFSCNVCNKKFKLEKHLRYHLKSHEPKESEGFMKCPLCSYVAFKSEHMWEHCEQIHNTVINCKEFELPSLDEFEKWICAEEGKTATKFAKNDTKNGITTYLCSSHNPNILYPKDEESNINCPSRIKVIPSSGGVCHVQYIETHITQSPERKEDNQLVPSHIAIKYEGVIFYKPIGTLFLNCPMLQKEDFFLIIMTSAQCDLLRNYGEDCICLDRVQRQLSRNFHLLTLLVLDELREGFPCAFCISNRLDSDVLKLFLSEIKKLAGVVTPQVFLSGLEDSYFDAWKDVMGLPEKRLFCSWNIVNDWKTNLAKFKTKEKQVLIYKELKLLVEEQKSSVFLKKINKFYEKFSGDQETKEFCRYFKDKFSSNFDSWAYCHRKNYKIYLEHMHKTVEYIFLKKGNIMRLDKTISSILNFIRDNLERVEKIDEKILSKKIKDLTVKHKKSLELDSNLLIISKSGWEFPSEKEKCVIQELHEICNCQIICSDCNTCIHKYWCSCKDSSLKFNMCVHIHLLNKWSKENSGKKELQSFSLDDDLEDIESIIVID